VLAVLALASPAAADEASLDSVRALLASYDQDPAKLDQARDQLTAIVARDPQPAALILLARTWFLIGDIRARTEAERLAAYEHGRDAGRRAIDAAPQRAEAHLWYAINLGRWAQTKGLLRATMELSTVKEEAETVLRLDPSSVEGHTLAGNLARELPGMLGGSNERAEQELRRALELDPHRPGIHVSLARLYIKTKRYADARRELTAALGERAPTDRSYWVVKGEPEAKALLDSIRDKN
jgi:predicted Zn-dependent protease